MADSYLLPLAPEVIEPWLVWRFVWFDKSLLHGLHYFGHFLSLPFGGSKAGLGLGCVGQREQLLLMSEVINIRLHREREFKS